MNPLLAKWAASVFARHGWRVQRTIDGAPNPAHLWDDDPRFQEAMRGVRHRTLVHDPACYILFRLVQQVRSLDGELAEVGVYRGGTAKLIHRAAAEPSAPLHLFDTFTGMPATDPVSDLHRPGDFADTSLSAVRDFLADCPGVLFHPGLFPDTAQGLEDRTFRFVHIDVDIRRSVADACAFFYPRLVGGGVLVVDDYGWTSTPGARRAVDEFFHDRPETPVYLPTGQALVVKI